MTHLESFLKRTCPVPIRENADLLALSGQDSLSANMLGRTYVKRQTDTRIVVLTYDFRSAFANPTLRRLFPSAELLEVFLLLFLLLAAFVLVITRQAKYLSRELFHLQEAADEIQQSESRLYHPADCHLRIQPGSRFSGRAEIRTFRLLKRAVAHAAATQTSVFRARP